MERDTEYWDRMLLKHVEHCREFLMERGAVPPMVLLFPYDSDTEIVAGLQMDQPTFPLLENIVRLLAVAHDAEAALFITEGWMVVTHEMDLAEAKKRVPRPSQHPDRVEMVALTLSYRAGDEIKRRAAFARLLRDDNGKPTGLDRPSGPHDAAAGLMTNVLSPDRPPPRIVAAAKRMIGRMSKDGAPPGVTVH